MVNHAAHLLSDFGGARLLSQTVTEEGSWSPLSTTSFSPHSMTPWFARLTTRSAKRNCFCSGPSELPVLGFCPCVSVRWISSPSLDSVRFLPLTRAMDPGPSQAFGSVTKRHKTRPEHHWDSGPNALFAASQQGCGEPLLEL